jgi:hypothetical protein
MVIRYQPARLRRNSDQPTAITGGLVATSQSSNRTRDIPLGTPTCSARTRHGLWALYSSGTEAVVVWPGGALAGPPAEVARELDRLSDSGQRDRHDELDRAAAAAIRQFLTDPDAHDGAPWPAPRARTWSSPATGYWISGLSNQPGHGDYPPSSWPGAPARPYPPVAPLPRLPAHPLRIQPDPNPQPAPQRAA